LSRDGTGAPSIRHSKAKKTHQEVGDRLRYAECNHPSADIYDILISGNIKDAE